MADLPQGYVLAPNVPALTVPVLFAQPVTLEQEYEARIGETEYTSLDEAINAVSSGTPATIDLLRDCELYNTFTMGGKTITINLNGHTLTGNITLSGGADLTINGTGGTMVGSIICNNVGCSLTINGGTYKNTLGDAFLKVYNAKALNITAGEFFGGGEYALYMDTKQIVSSGIFVRRNITGGMFHGIYDTNSDKTLCRQDGYCFNVGDQKLKLSEVKDNTTKTLTIKQCTTHDYENGKSCVYCGLEKQVEYVAQVGDEKYYETFEAAVEAASAVGGTVKLIKDCTISNAVTVNSSITIDLNGKCLTTSSGKELKINGGKVTITSSTGTGRIGSDRSNAVVLSGGMLTVDSGVILQGYGGIFYAVSVSGGDLILNQGAILLYGIKTNTGADGIYAYLASGTAFAEYDSATAAGSLVNGYTTKDYSGDLIVVEHTSHDYSDIGECPCGYICPHTDWDENGVCNVCQKSAAAALTVNGQTEFFMNATAALDKAQRSAGEVTLKLLKTVRLNGRYFISCGTFTVDMNGYALGWGSLDVARIDGADVTVISSAEQASGWYCDFEVYSGKLTFKLRETFAIRHLSVYGGEVTISGGNFYDTTGVNLYGGTVRISGGVFEQTYINNNADVKISGGTFRELRLEDGRTLKDILAKNKAFAREDGTELALTLTEFMEWNNVTVRDHVHNMENNKCTICGFECNHVDGNVDCGDAITGKCTKCGALIYGASLQQGGSSAEGFDTLEEALKEYQKLPIDEPVTLRLFKTFSDPFASAFSVNAPLVIEGVCGNGFACHGITVEAGRSLTMNLHGLGYVSDGTFDVSGSLTVNSGNITCSGTSLTLNNGAIFTMNGGKIEGYNANDDAVTLNDGSTFTMTDGNVSVLKVAGAATVNISGGQVSTLDALASAAEDAAVELSGGTFGTIRTYGTGTVKDWLKSQYAFWSGSTPVDRSVLTASHELTNVSVALCDSHAFSSGVCRYCGYPCTHPDVVNNQCMTCHAMIYARITAGETVTYYDSVISAFEALNKITESPVTLAILGTPTANRQLKVSKTVTLDLSNGSITKESEGNGSYSLEVCGGANLTITGSGAVKCTMGSIEGNGILVSGGSLNVRGGEFGVADKADNNTYGLVVRGGTVRLYGGTFHGISAPSSATGGLPALLAPGCAYFTDAEGKNIVQSTSNGIPLYSTNATLYVLSHKHNFENGVCACGVAYVVKLTAKGKDRFYTDFLEAYRATDWYDSATLQLLRDVDIGATFIGGASDQQSDNLTLDLNGHTLTGSDSDVLYVGNRRTVILMDSSGNNTGSIKNTSKGPAVSVGNLAKATIESGTYSPYVSVEREGGATLTISGGVFQPDGQMSALACSNGNLGSTATLRDLLPAGKTLAYDPNGTELVDVYAIAQAGENAGAYIATAGGKTVYVVSHTRHDVNAATGKCGCGYAPVAAVAAGESVAYFDTFDAAVTEAQKTSGSTLTLMQDVTLAENAVIYIASGSFTIDWHGHTLRGSTNMELLTVTQAANLTLMDSKNNAGGVTNSGEICGAAVGFYCDSTGSLTITGGTYSPAVKKMGYGKLQISSGVFQCPQGSSQNFALYNDKGDLSDILAPGYGFYNVNSDGSPSLAKFYGVNHSDENATVTVGEHKQHRLQDNGLCVCDCGLRCWQKYLDENGHCDTCGYTFVAKVIVWTDYFSKTSSYFLEGKFNEAISHALNNPPAGTNDSSSVILLSDAVYSGEEAWNQNIDMDLNGHKLTLEKDAVVSGKVLILYGDQNSIIDGDGALSISKGLLTVKENSNPRIGYLKLDAGARATLAGGTYGKIVDSSDAADITLGSLLPSGYVFQSIGGTTIYKNSEKVGSGIYDVKVVACAHGEYDSDGHCVYCNAECAHKAPADMTDPKCPDCGIPFVASVTFEGDVTYFTSVSTALTQVASCTSESGSAATLALLRSADLTEPVTVHGKVPITLDLNGHSLTAQNDAQITLEDLGADFPLVTFTDSHPGTNKSNVTVAVDHVRGWNARSASVVSGHWGTFNVKGHLTMSGGEVDVIDLDAKGAAIQPTAQISAGTVRFLDFDGKSKVTLFGGRYGRIYAAVQSTAFNYTTLLGDGNYAFAFTNESGENRRLPYAIMKDYVGGVLNVEVVKCGTDKYPHVYKDADGNPSDTCLYCNYQCKHTQVDETTFTCDECGLAMEASVTQGSETRYFWHYCDAHADAGDAKNAEAGEATLKLLKDAVCNDGQRFDKNVTLDLNGYDITGTSGYSTSVGVTLTLTDSSSGDEAKWGTCGLVIGAGGLKGQISKVVVKSGNWSNLVVNNDTDITMTGGSVTFLEFLGTGAENSTISGGTVGRLRVYNANIKLSGGTFVAITYPKTYTESVATADLLAEKCAFAQKDSQGEWQRLEHKNLPTLGTGGDLKNVTVVQCGIGEYLHGFVDGVCKYCNYECEHTAGMDSDMKCIECGIQFVTSLAYGSTTEYFTDIYSAFEKANKITGVEAATITLLHDTELGNGFNVTGYVPLTFDLKGKQLTRGSSAVNIGVIGAKLTLKDSADGGIADADETTVVAANGGEICIAGGTWYLKFIAGNGGTVNVTGGSIVPTLGNVDGETRNSSVTQYLGGTVTVTAPTSTWITLYVTDADGVTLKGGSYHFIRVTNGGDVWTKDLLAKDTTNNIYYTFANPSPQPGKEPRYLYSTYKDSHLIDGSEYQGASVVECKPHEYENGTGYCIYCNYQCPHTDIDPVTGKCTICKYQMVASVTKGYNDITYYEDFASAMAAATADGDDGRLLTLLDNASVGGGDWTVPSRVHLTIDLNGKTLNSGTTDSRNISVGTMATLLLTDNTGKGSALVSVSVNVKGGAVNVGSGTWWWDITAQSGGIVNITGGSLNSGSVTQQSGGTVNVTKDAAETWIGSLYVIDADKVSLAGGKYGSIKKTEDILATSIPAKNLLADGYTYANTSGRLGYNIYKDTDFIIPTVTMSSVFVVKCDPHRYNNTGLCIYCNYQCPHTNVDPATGVCGTCNMQFAATVTQDGTTKCYVTLPEAVTAVNSATGTGDITLKLVDGCDLAESLTFTKSVTLDLNGKTITDNKKFLVAGKDVTLTLTDTVENSTASGGRIDGKERSAIVVESGTWDVITVNGTLQMEGGRVTSLRITDNAGSAVIGNGRVDKLDVANSANVRLTGGFFGEIVSSNGVAPTALLKEDYAFSRDEDGTGKRHYASLNTPDSTTVNAYVVECTSHEYDSDTGFCIYCNDECKHPNLDANGKCETCGMQMAATVTQDGKTEYYATLAEAVVAAHSATGSTVKLLTDNVLTEAITSTATMTLDLNGKRLTKRNTAGEFFVEGGTLTLVDSVGDGTAETIRFTFRNESRAKLQSGKWGELHCFGRSRFSMEEGEAASIIANCEFFEVRDGKVGYLNVQNKYVTLVGGFFGRIASSLTLAEGESPIPAFQLLGGRHVFQKGDGRVKYADLPSLPDGELLNVSVVKCDPHDFEGTNYCIYCHLYCKHEVLDKDTGYCAYCENQIYEARIGDSYYPTLEAALAAAAAMSGNPTVTMLCNCGLDATYEVTGAYTLDLNGHELTSEGHTFPLHVKSGTLTIQDSKGTGKVSSKFGNGVKTDKGAMLIVEGGTFGQHRSNGYNGLGLSLAAGSARLRGGTFHSISSVSKLADIVDNGYWYYENDQLYKVGKSNGTNVTLTVKPHTHTYVDGECACGTLAQASVTTTDGTVTYYTAFEDALGVALKDENRGCTLTLLNEPKLSGSHIQTRGDFTLNLNGQTLSGDATARWNIHSGASVQFTGTGNVNVSIGLHSGKSGTAFYGGTYGYIQDDQGYLKQLSEQNHFAFTNADGNWVDLASGANNYQKVTATAVPYVAVQPANASVSYGADQLPAEMTKLAASFESDWTVSAAWYYKNASGQWVAITDSKTLTSGTAYGAQQFDNTGFIVGQYTLRCDLTATKQGFPEFKVSSNEVTLTVTEAAPTFTAPKAATNLVYNGAAQALVSAGETGDGTLMYSNSQDGTYSADIPTGTDAGPYQVWYKVVGDGNHSDSTPAKLDVTIAKARASSVEIRLTNELTYNGTKQTQNVEIWLGEHNVTEQFTISGNQQTAAGDYILSISAAANGNFDGFESTWWKIAPKNISGATINLGEALTYKGREQTQTVTSVTVDGLDVTYTVSDNVQTNAGTYTLTVTGTGNFTGTATKDWTIAPKDISNAVITLGDTLTYNGQEQTQTVTSVTVDGLSVTYDVTGNTGTDVKDYTLTITGTGNFTGTATKDWTIAPKDISNAIITLDEALTYNGQEQVQTIDSVTVDDLTVTYDASNDRGTNAGAYTLTVTGTGNFTGAATAKFTIAQREVTITNAAVDTSKVYDGNTSARIAYAGIISNKVANDDVKIVQGTAAYDDKNVGTAKTVTFTGFTLDGSAAANYILTGQPADTLADITAREITVTVTVKEKTFDGTTNAEIDSATLDNVVSGDDVKLTGGKPTLAGATPGEQNVTFEDFILEGEDAGNYSLTNPQPDGVTATVTTNSSYLDLTDESDFDGQTDVSIDGDRYPIQEEGEKRYVTLPASCSLLTIYTYVSGDATASHTNYPTSMRVYRILREDTGATVEHIPELDDLLIYNGCSIRVTGKQGIRMITGISKSNKAALTGSGLAGYTLVEYGTVVCWADGLPAGETLTLGKSCARSNFAYRRGVSDPVFAQSGAAMQYTNVLVGFGLDQCSRDLIMRPYITLRDAGGATVTLYGGSVQRSIGYIATQNRTVFPAGTPAYEYVWNIIHAVYGDAYDSDYQG